MSVPALNFNNHLARAVNGRSVESDVDVKCINALAYVEADSVVLCFRSLGDPVSPGRPYLHIRGNAVALSERNDLNPQNNEAFPYGLTTLRMRDDANRIPVDAFYQFDDAQLADLVGKGLYSREFSIPDSFYKTHIEMPVEARLKVIAPQEDGETPIVFADIAERWNVYMDKRTSGYDFTEDFIDVPMPDLTKTFEEPDYPEMLHMSKMDLKDPMEQMDMAKTLQPQVDPEQETQLSDEDKLEADLQTRLARIENNVAKHLNPDFDPLKQDVKSEPEESGVSVIEHKSLGDDVPEEHADASLAGLVKDTAEKSDSIPEKTQGETTQQAVYVPKAEPETEPAPVSESELETESSEPAKPVAETPVADAPEKPEPVEDEFVSESSDGYLDGGDDEAYEALPDSDKAIANEIMDAMADSKLIVSKDIERSVSKNIADDPDMLVDALGGLSNNASVHVGRAIELVKQRERTRKQAALNSLIHANASDAKSENVEIPAFKPDDDTPQGDDMEM